MPDKEKKNKQSLFMIFCPTCKGYVKISADDFLGEFVICPECGTLWRWEKVRKAN